MSSRPPNGFLQSLSPASYLRVSSNLKVVDLEHSRNVSHSGDPIEWVYFPVSCLISLITRSSSGQGVETSMAGNEGASGLVEACGGGVSQVQAVVQIDGRAWRWPAAACRALVSSDPEFAAQAWKLTELQLFEARQSGLCQGLHPVEARFCRWLLESIERSAGRNPLPLTQEFVAVMLGVQRTTVSAFASQLQKEGFITYSRGQLAVVDMAAVGRRACECHDAVRQERDRLGFQAGGASSANAA